MGNIDVYELHCLRRLPKRASVAVGTVRRILRYSTSLATRAYEKAPGATTAGIMLRSRL